MFGWLGFEVGRQFGPICVVVAADMYLPSLESQRMIDVFDAPEIKDFTPVVIRELPTGCEVLPTEQMGRFRIREWHND